MTLPIFYVLDGTKHAAQRSPHCHAAIVGQAFDFGPCAWLADDDPITIAQASTSGPEPTERATVDGHVVTFTHPGDVILTLVDKMGQRHPLRVLVFESAIAEKLPADIVCGKHQRAKGLEFEQQLPSFLATYASHSKTRSGKYDDMLAADLGTFRR